MFSMHIFKKGSLSHHYKRKSQFIKSVSVNSCGIQTSHRLTYLILVIWLSIVFLEMLVISRAFSTNMNLIKSVSVVAAAAASFISSKFFRISSKPFLLNYSDDRNSCSTTCINNTNLIYNIICIIIFFSKKT